MAVLLMPVASALLPKADALAWVAVLLVQGALAAIPGSQQAVGGLLVATLLVLAIIEHGLLVLPFNATALWGWAMRGREAAFQDTQPVIEPDEKLLHAR